MTKNEIAAALLAGSVVSVGLLTMQFNPAPASAQNRETVQSAHDNHQALRYRVIALPDGGTATADLLQGAANTCRASRRAVQTAKTRHYASGTPDADTVKALMDTETADCGALDTLRASVHQAKTAHAGAKDAYDCTYLRSCDGGS